MLLPALFFCSCKKSPPKVRIIMKYSPHCEACLMMKPIVSEIKKFYGDKIDIKLYNQEIYEEYQESSAYKSKITPAFFFINSKGEIYEHFEGPVETAVFKSAVEKGLE